MGVGSWKGIDVAWRSLLYKMSPMDWMVGILTDDDEFDYDKLDNRESVEDRDDNTITILRYRL